MKKYILTEEQLWELLFAEKYLELLREHDGFDYKKTAYAENLLYDWAHSDEKYEALKKYPVLKTNRQVHDAYEAWKRRRLKSLNYQLQQEGNFFQISEGMLVDTAFDS